MEFDGLNTAVYGGTFQHWLIALGIAAVMILGFRAVKPFALRRLSARAGHSHTRFDDALLAAFQATKLGLVGVIALYVGAQFLELPETAGKVLGGGATIAMFLQVGLWGAAMLKFWLGRSRARALATDAGTATSLSALGFIASVVLWTVIVLMMLDNLGFNVTALVAGLGVGGIAVALAMQNILGDLFASLSIVLDKPFVIGDFIIVDDYMGTVENVGLKTTRIRSVDGELLVFSNSDLLKSRVRNYKRMSQRRVVFTFSVPYETPLDRVEQIPAVVKRIIEGRDKVRLERSHFQKLGASSLVFETVYWMVDPDYDLYMDTQQDINFKLMREFAQAKIEFAFPPRAVRVHVEEPVEAEKFEEKLRRQSGRPAL